MPQAGKAANSSSSAAADAASCSAPWPVASSGPQPRHADIDAHAEYAKGHMSSTTSPSLVQTSQASPIVEAIGSQLATIDLSTLDGTSVSPPPIESRSSANCLSPTPSTYTTYRPPSTESSTFVPAASYPASPGSINSFPSISRAEFSPSLPAGTATASFPEQTDEDKRMFLNAAQRRRNMAMTPALTEYEADLNSKDRMRQKEAIKAIMASKIKTDWSFPTDPVDMAQLKPSPSKRTTTETEHTEDGQEETKWVERLDWSSELSSSEEEDSALYRVGSSGSHRPSLLHRLSGSFSKHSSDPFRFDNPEAVGEALKRRVEKQKLRRQRRLNDELEENEGLRVFHARRNAWSGAKVVKRPKLDTVAVASPKSQKSSRSASKSAEDTDMSVSPSNRSSGSNKPTVDTSLDDSDSESDEDTLYDTLIPIAPPLLPPNTPMRKNITSRAYTTIYDKVILQSQTPFCPINLQTVINSCVEGWKRDGEWPPKGTEPEAMLSRKKVPKDRNTGEGREGWRRSLQRVFGKGADVV